MLLIILEGNLRRQHSLIFCQGSEVPMSPQTPQCRKFHHTASVGLFHHLQHAFQHHITNLMCG